MSKHMTFSKYGRHLRRGCIRRSQILPSVSGDADGLPVFVISDLHTDYTENMKWVKDLSSVRYKNDVLFVAGDGSETYNNFMMTMSILKNKFEHVLYVPGNHDLWCRREGEIHLDSHHKLNKVLDVCRDLGVETNPIAFDGLGIIPLLSWYHESFDKEGEITNICVPPYRWQELCPEKRMLFYPKLPKIIGSDSLGVRIRSIHGRKGSASACHVFGHTHFCWDAVLDGIRIEEPFGHANIQSAIEVQGILLRYHPLISASRASSGRSCIV